MGDGEQKLDTKTLLVEAQRSDGLAAVELIAADQPMPKSLDEALAEIAVLRQQILVLNSPANGDRAGFVEADGARPSGRVPVDEPQEQSADFNKTYFDLPLWRLLTKRLPWLAGLLILQSFSAAMLHAFEALLEQHLVIAVFVPMIVGTGGNAGNQPGVLVTRALATGNVNMRLLLIREAVLSVSAGIILAALTFARVLLEYPDDALSAAALAVSLFVLVVSSALLGIFFSWAMHRANNVQCDPADGSAPMLTTMSDLLGIACLCGLSVLFLGS